MSYEYGNLKYNEDYIVHLWQMKQNSRNRSNLFHLGEIRVSSNQSANTFLKGYWWIMTASPMTACTFSRQCPPLNTTPVSHIQLFNPSVLGVRLNDDPHTRAELNKDLCERFKQEGSQQQQSSNGTQGRLGIQTPWHVNFYFTKRTRRIIRR